VSEKARIAKEAFDAANHRLNELKMKAATLQPPTVMVLGMNQENQ
jgi:hypothetical protein